MKDKFQQIKDSLLEIKEWEDTEIAHMKADEQLIRIALDTEMHLDDRLELINIYKSINKWYA